MPKERLKMDPGRSPVHTREDKREGKVGKVAWMREFREMLRENPGIVRAAIRLADQAVAEYDPPEIEMENEEGLERKLKYEKATSRWLRLVEDEIWATDSKGKIYFPELDEGVKLGDWIPMDFGRGTLLYPGNPIADQKTSLVVSILGRSNREFQRESFTVRNKCDYFIMTIDGKSFFVKRSFVTTTPGVAEFKNSMTAKEILKDLPFVKVVESELGFQNKDESWYVPRWENIENAGYESYNQLTLLPTGLAEKAAKIRQRLTEAGLGYDIGANLFYNPGTDHFILLDVTGNERFGNPFIKTPT